MNKIILPILFASILFSCKKQTPSPEKYTCTCKVETALGYKTNSYVYENMSYEAAKEECSSLNGNKTEVVLNSSYSENWSCNLSK